MSNQLRWSPPKLCAQCQHFGGWVASSHAWCLHGSIVHANPWQGCVYWVRWVPETQKAPKPEGLGESDGT